MASINERNLKLGDKSKFQLILLGYDGTKEGNEGYVTGKKLNFPAIKVEGRDAITDLLKTGDTGFIPNVVLLKPDGSLVSNDQNVVMKKLIELAPE